MDGKEAAIEFINKNFPDCYAAMLSGSVARNEQRANSDLDILVFTREEVKQYRKSYRDFGWFIEVFVQYHLFCEEKLHQSAKNRNPSFLTSCAEGVVLKDSQSFAKNLKERAQAILEKGPEPLTPQEINLCRYVITDWLDDFIDSESLEESLFIVYDLTAKTAELLLAYYGRWTGERKRLYRVLKRLDNELSRQLIEGLENYYRTGEKEKLINSVLSVLNLVGGKFYEGFSG